MVVAVMLWIVAFELRRRVRYLWSVVAGVFGERLDAEVALYHSLLSDNTYPIF